MAALILINAILITKWGVLILLQSGKSIWPISVVNLLIQDLPLLESTLDSSGADYAFRTFLLLKLKPRSAITKLNHLKFSFASFGTELVQTNTIFQ